MRLAPAFTMVLALTACKRPAPPPAQEPLQVMHDFTMKQAENGLEKWFLTARTATLQEGTHKAFLSYPQMDFIKAKRTASHLTADSGIIRTDTMDVWLSTSVVVTSMEDKSVLRTEELQYIYLKGRVYTDRDVTVTRPGGVLHGRGLEANPDLSEIHIFHQTSVLDKGVTP